MGLWRTSARCQILFLLSGWIGRRDCTGRFLEDHTGSVRGERGGNMERAQDAYETIVEKLRMKPLTLRTLGLVMKLGRSLSSSTSTQRF
jgi:hypothetical protein